MRVALFTPYLPLPAVTGGRIRISELSGRLAEGAEVHLFATGLATREARAALELHRERYASVHLGIDRFAFLRRGVPRRVARCRSGALRRAFSRLHAERPFDLAVVEHSYAAPLALESDLPIVLNEHNVESRFHEASRDISERELAQFRSWEEKVWARASAIACVSKADAEHVRSRGGRHVRVIPNGVDTHALEYLPPSSRRSRDVLFVGLMSHRPNIEAAEKMALEVMPEVWDKVPDARLVLCGHAPKPRVRELEGPNVLVTGSVPSTAPWMAAARVIVCPLLEGAGTSLKVVEALASGAPLVTTPVGRRGYPTEIDDLCDVTPIEGFAERIVELLDSPGDDARAAQARNFAEGWDWRELAKRYTALVEGSLPVHRPRK